MASQFSLIAFGKVMESAVVLSATSEATGYPKESLIDWNLDIPWRPTSTANQTLVIDLGAAQTVNCFAICFGNYTTDFSATTIDWESSTDNSNWTNRITANAVVSGYHWVVGNIGSDISARYWRAVLKTQANIPDIVALAAGYKYDITLGNQKPEITETAYQNELIETYSGRAYTTSISRDAIRRSHKVFYFPLVANQTALKGAFDDSFGRRYPILVLEGTDVSTYYMARFDSDVYTTVESSYGVYEPQVTFVESQYIRSGKNF